MIGGACMLQHRKRAGLSLRELAAMAGVQYNTICRLERGTHLGRIDTLELLADALGLSIDEYVGHTVKERAE